jgi:hypothetical protein
MFPVVVHISVDGSYNSVAFKATLLDPPATNTFPFINTDAV